MGIFGVSPLRGSSADSAADSLLLRSAVGCENGGDEKNWHFLEHRGALWAVCKGGP